MATKKPGRRKLARIRVVKEAMFGQPVPSLELTYLLPERETIIPGPFSQVGSVYAMKQVVVNFTTPCPHCKRGITGEIVGRL